MVIHILTSNMVRIERYRLSPDHLHSLQDVDQVKRPTIVRNLIIKEATKPYSPPAIVSTVKELADKEGIGATASFTNRVEVANIQKKYRQSALTRLIGSSNRGQDMQDAISYLQSKGFLSTV